MDYSIRNNDDSDTFDFGSTDFDDSQFDTSEFSESRIETYDPPGPEPVVSEFEMSELEVTQTEEVFEAQGLTESTGVNEVNEFETTEFETTEFETTEFQTTEFESAETGKVEQAVVSPPIAKPSARRKSGSFIRTMDKLIVSSAITLFGLWLAGHAVLWLIGGSSGSSTMSQTASRDSGSPAVAKLTKVSSSDETSEYAAASLRTEAPEAETNYREAPSDDGQSSQADELVANPASPTETSFRPTYTEPTTSVEAKPKSVEPELGAPDQSSWAPDEPVTPQNDWAAKQNSPVDAPGLDEEVDSSSGFQFGNNTQLDVGQSKPEFGVDAGPIDKLPVPVETVEPKAPEVATEVPVIEFKPSSADIFTAPKTYPMRVWTSARGSKANLALVRVEGSDIVVVDEKGQQFSLPFGRFSAEDRAYVRDAIRD